MKKQLSKRIGAILTMAAMLAALLPMAMPVMATGETSTNLITNGDFTDGNLNGWTIVGDSNKVEIGTSATIMKTVPALKVTSNSSISVSQEVRGLTPEKSYKLSMDHVCGTPNANDGVEVELIFGRYADGTFTPLSDCDDYTASIDKTVAERRLLGSGVKVVKNVSLNFNAPPTADAVKVTIEPRTSNAKYVTLIDNITLAECTAPIEMINNGAVEAVFNDGEYYNKIEMGWTRKASGTVSSTIEKDADGNSYMKMFGHRSVAIWEQDISLRPGKVYKLSFKYSQNGLGDNAAPRVLFDIKRDDVIDFEPVFTGASSTDTIEWKEYEALITVDKPAEDYAYELVDATLTVTSLGESKWKDGGAMYYDDISLQEVDVETDMFFSIGENGVETKTAADAKAASCIFVQGETANAVQNFIVAKYNSTTNGLESATVVNAGEGIAAGNAKRYDVEIADNASSYYRIFLFEGETLKPIFNSEEIGR